ncbi:glycosyltransferase family 2 protein [Flavivirga amylovorans]|uniref:Glycosyltransferase family 2 protein n=1 Tax=Flavivirga amylovorans TaxID=870486 RepID=A0ABT8WXJ0_9FLAO|nr:glycosyltransferase family 2 protein [Flavivirga amylovorans]MDO5986375.1 glycosyltransferase family 2 protein [Flavivirga amylovorans]
MDSLVSIIIPAYNRSQLISETLDSILAQTYTNWECIIVDDGSTDNTTNIVKEYSIKDSRFSIKNRPSGKQKGANACRNYGHKLSKGDYVLFLDSDDILKNTCLENRLHVFKTSKSIDFVIANSSYIKDNVFYNKPICEFPSDFSSEKYLNLFLSYKFPWTIMSVLWKKETIQDFEFDENLMRLQDIDYHIKILLAKPYNCYRINKIDNYYRLNDKKSFSEKTVNLNLISLIEFNQTQLNQLDLEKHKKYLTQFNCKIVLQFLTPNFNKNRIISNRVLFCLFNSKIYNFKQKTYILLLMFFLNTNLFNLRRIGMNKFRSHFRVVMNLVY